MTAADVEVFTVGHSTRSLDALVAILQEADVRLLADIRRVPRSRRLPHFAREELAQSLPAEGMAYEHVPALGGFRHGSPPDSPNAGWRNASFRAFADYMQGEEFASAIDELLSRARTQRTAVMCSEAVPWRCHRSLVADALVARGASVTHLLGVGRGQPHALTPFARVEGTLITYPASAS